MFNRTTHVNASWPSTVKVEQHNAPTADMARLYGELREKAVDEVIRSGPIADNVLGEIVTWKDMHSLRTVARFLLNGHEYTIRVDADRVSDLAALRRAVADAVADVLVQPVATTKEK